MIKNVHTHIVIMAGGIGSRLWPSVLWEYILLEPIDRNAQGIKDAVKRLQ